MVHWGPNFAQNLSISYGFEIHDGHLKSEKSKFFTGATGVVISTLGIEKLPKITLSVTVFEINDIFKSAKIQVDS